MKFFVGMSSLIWRAYW